MGTAIATPIGTCFGETSYALAELAPQCTGELAKVSTGPRLHQSSPGASPSRSAGRIIRPMGTAAKRGNELEIRSIDYALDADRRALVELLDLYATEPIGGSTSLAADVRNRLPDFLRDHPASRVWLAFLGEEPVGLATGIVGYSSFAARPLVNIHDLVVRPEFRGRAIGRALLSHIEREARALDYCGLTLEVRGDNVAAQSLYASCGFVGSGQVEPPHHSAFWKKRLDS